MTAAQSKAIAVLLGVFLLGGLSGGALGYAIAVREEAERFAPGHGRRLRAFAREPYEIQRFDETNRNVYDARVHVLHEWSRIMPTSHFLVALSTILILWFGGNMVLSGEITLGEMVAFNGYLLMIAEPARQMVWLVNSAGEAGAGLKRTFDVLDLQSEIASPPDAVKLPLLSGRVEFLED